MVKCLSEGIISIHAPSHPDFNGDGGRGVEVFRLSVRELNDAGATAVRYQEDEVHGHVTDGFPDSPSSRKRKAVSDTPA